MDIWEGRWAQAATEDYEALFGRVGWQSIQDRKNKINTLLDNILGHLDLKAKLLDSRPSRWKQFFTKFVRKRNVQASRSSSPTGSFVSATSHLPLREPVGLNHIGDSATQAWQLYVRNENGASDTNPSDNAWALPEKPDVTVMDRIIGVLYSNQQLDKKIDEFGKAIDRLHVLSRQLYGKQGHGTLNSDPEKEEVGERLQIYRIQKFAEEVYQSYLWLRSQYRWKSELRIPSDME